METGNKPVYGNIAVYKNYCTVLLKKDYTLRYLEFMCSVCSPLRRHGQDTDKCTLTTTYTKKLFLSNRNEVLKRMYPCFIAVINYGYE